LNVGEITNLEVREWLNAALIPLNVCIMFIIAHSLFEARRIHGHGWTDAPGVKSACAFWWIFLADLIRASMAWSFLNAQNDGRSTDTISSAATIFYLVAALIAALATFRLIHALSPIAWGHKGWAAAAGLTVVFVVALIFIA
jgi:predicted Co/Zn/Cd cation transporter (cation efflux family)